MTTTVVTGEAVVLQLRPATFISRAAGALIDALVIAVVLFALVVIFPEPMDLDPAAAQAVVLAMVVGLLVGLPVLWEALSRGRSPGKWALGLRVVRDDGGAVRLRHVVVRVLVGVFELWLTAGSVATVAALLNERVKRLGDMAAGTQVIVERQPKAPPPLPGVPARLEPWAQVADIGRVPDALAVAITRFLRQAPSMSVPGRRATAARLLADVGAFVTPGPPAGTDPEDFLLAIVAERRNRDYRILTARHARAEAAAGRVSTLPYP